MTQIFDEKGEVQPATIIQAGPCFVTQIKNNQSDGYTATQIGFGNKKNLSKALKGHLKNLGEFAILKEFRFKNDEITQKLSQGTQLNADIFDEKEKIKITGYSKGKGYQGVVKKYGFAGTKATHGNKDQLRATGSIGATEPARVFKNSRMPGHMGNIKTTIKNLEIIKIDKEQNLIYIKGAVPGRKNSMLLIQNDRALELKNKQEKSSDNQSAQENQ